jgi:hypothetical protein
MRVVVLRRQDASPSEADLPMATHAAVNASEWGLVAWAVVLVEGRVTVLTQVIFLLVNGHSQSPRWWLRRNVIPVAVPGGYRFAQGDPTSSFPKWLHAADGTEFVLSIDRLGPVLRQRSRRTAADADI